MPTYSISGTTTVGGATVTYTGTASGSVTCDAVGNYSITGLSNGGYTLSVNALVAPTSQNVIVNNANVTGINFARGQVAGTIYSFDKGEGFIQFSGTFGGTGALTYFSIENFHALSGLSFTLTAVTVSMGVATYTGTVTGGDSNALVGVMLSVFDFTNDGNNVSFTVTASTATTLACVATTQVNESNANAFATNGIPKVGLNVLFNFNPDSSEAVNISAG
jgi:hypothetical protein